MGPRWLTPVLVREKEGLGVGAAGALGQVSPSANLMLTYISASLSNQRPQMDQWPWSGRLPWVAFSWLSSKGLVSY